MNKMIKVLYDKKNRAVPFMEEDIALAKQIAVSGSPSGKIDLIFYWRNTSKSGVMRF